MRLLLIIVSPVAAPLALVWVCLKIWIAFIESKIDEEAVK